MSDTTQTSLDNINFTGGFPTSKDLVPSIIFLVVYALLVPLIIFRLIRKADRTRVLLRPGIFVTCRIGMLIIRAYMSKNTYGEGLLVAELILVTIGFLFLIEPAVTMWKLHVESATPRDVLPPKWVKTLSTLLRILVLAAIVTAIAGASSISGALKDPSKLGSVKTLRKISAVLSMLAAAFVLLATIRTHSTFPVSRRGTVYLAALSACLIVISVYRVLQTFSTDPDATVRTAAAFWILQMLFELIAFVLLLAISIPTWFPGNSDAKDVPQYDLESQGTLTHVSPEFQSHVDGR